MMEEFFTLKDGRIVHIREARVEDAERLHAFYKVVTTETEFLITKPDEVFTVSEERALINVYRSTFNRLYLVALSGSSVVASLKIAGGRRKRVSHSGELSIAVRRDFWGRGLGRRMMEMGISWAKGVLKRIELNVVDNNDRAIRLYESLGFKLEGVKKRAVRLSDGFHDVYIMALLLD